MGRPRHGDGRDWRGPMTNLLDVYRTQISVLREWRGGPVALIKRLIIVLVVSVISSWSRSGSSRPS